MKKKIKHLSGATALGFYSVSLIAALIAYALSKGIDGVVLTTGITVIAAITAGIGGYKLRVIKDK